MSAFTVWIGATSNFIVVLLMLVIGLLQGICQSQAPPGTTGDVPFSTANVLSPYESINLANQVVNLSVPVRSKPGRIPLKFFLSGSASVYKYIFNSSSNWQSALSIQRNAEGNLTGGLFAHSPGVLLAGLSYTMTWRTGCGSLTGQFATFSQFMWEDETGAVHPFTPMSVSTCGPSTQTGTSTDGSGLFLSVTTTQGPGSGHTYKLLDRSGNNVSTALLKDTNGNTVSSAIGSTTTTVTDSLGQTVLSYNSSSVDSTHTVWTYTYTDAAGISRSVTITYQPFSIDTAACATTFVATEWLPTSVSLPDGTSLGISYLPSPNNSANVTGFIQALTLPTGTTVSYSYPAGFSCTNTTPQVTIPPTMTRTTPEGTWTYNYTPPASGTLTSSTSVTDPAGNKTVYNFASGYETQRIYYDSAGSVKRTVVTCYNGNTTGCATPASLTTPITQTDVYTYLDNTTTNPSELHAFYNSAGLVTEVKKYDFGPVLVLDTTTMYGTYSSGSCVALGNNIQDRQCLTTVKDSSGNTLAQTRYTYDPAGNLLSASSLASGSNYLTKSYSYGSGGVLATATDVNGTLTTYTNNGCNSSFPTTISGGGLSPSQTWDCNGGVITTSTDANGQIATYNYINNNVADPFWRLLSVTDPTSTVASVCYGLISNGVCNPNQAQVETVLTFNSGGSSVDKLVTSDWLGRTILSQTRQGPGSANFDSVQYSYAFNSTGAVVTMSVPYVGTAGQPAPVGTPVTTTQYDALGRIASASDAGGGNTSYIYSLNDVLQTFGPAPTTQKQLEYDGLARLKSVCEITAGTSAWPGGNCAQISPQTGYWTKYAYDALGNITGVTQNAQGSTVQTRSFNYDALGRLTSETNPEWNSLATTYIYDTDATCGTSNGDGVKKLDPAGNVTCTAFDSLHRPTSVTYPSGPNAAATPTKTFVYDAATVNSKVMQLAKGRLAEAYTGPTGSKTTDLGFSYDADGRIIDFYESTPHSSGYYDVTASYWENNMLKTLKGVTLPTLTYAPDGEGRPNTVSASTGISPVVATAYNTAGQATDVTFGSTSGPGDPVHFGFDPNTGRMTQYKLTINGTATHGDPVWNPNGTLGSLTITDPFNASDAQTCNYGYDDMARLASAHCGATIWQQDFTYDPFGNITKTVPTGGTGQQFQPGYDVRNHYTDGATYDADGNLTNDGTDHVYTWDSDGHPVTLDSETLLYDALGREVEVFKSGAYTEFVFGPTGKLALMNGQTQTKAFVPLPGRTQVKYAGNTISTYRLPDWLGSFRVGSNPNRTYSWGVAFAPFGEMYAQSGSPAWSFTGEQGTADTVNDEYDFLARKLHSAQGRWISPDPAGLSATDPANPQSWNRYAYVGNNPLALLDPTGLGADCPGGPQRNRSCDFHQPGDFRQGGCNADGADIPCDMVMGGMARDEFAVMWQQFSQSTPRYQATFIVGYSSNTITFSDSTGTVLGTQTVDFPLYQTVSIDPCGDYLCAGNHVVGLGLRGILDDPLGNALIMGVGGLARNGLNALVPRTLYRVFGNGSRGMGQYWTTVDPSTVPNYRATAGLYPANSGAFVAEGTLVDTRGVTFGSAARGPGGLGGGLREVFVPNPEAQIIITRVSGVNPPF